MFWLVEIWNKTSTARNKSRSYIFIFEYECEGSNYNHRKHLLDNQDTSSTWNVKNNPVKHSPCGYTDPQMPHRCWHTFQIFFIYIKNNFDPKLLSYHDRYIPNVCLKIKTHFITAINDSTTKTKLSSFCLIDIYAVILTFLFTKIQYFIRASSILNSITLNIYEVEWNFRK